MSLLKQLLTLVTLAVASITTSATQLATPESLEYKVYYKWGIIHKHAGNATISVRRAGSTYMATATGRSVGFAETFYPLRDTLRTTMRIADLAPSRYERIAHENGRYARDVVTFTRSGNNVTGKSIIQRRKKKQDQLSESTKTMTATGMTVDLLSSFYYLRSLPFSTMTPGTTRRINIFSGKRKEWLTITYDGVTSLKLDGRDVQTYKVKFTFTSDGKKETSDPIEAWISAAQSQIPLKIVGKLKVGQVQCIYSGK